MLGSGRDGSLAVPLDVANVPHLQQISSGSRAPRTSVAAPL
jgi:hypothetical protein